MQRGDVVWARVVFPHSWWPGVVLRIDSLGVLVSFFDLQPNRYFLNSELRPFDHTFRSSMVRNNKDELFDRALEVFGRRTLRSLTCPCQRTNRSGPRDLRGTTSFQAVGVLGFVLRMGVSPLVEETEFVEAVRSVAQVQAFRGYGSAKRTLMYKGQCQRRGSEKKNSVFHESDILELEDESQLFFEEVENKLAVGVTNRTNSKIPGLKESFNEHQLCSMSETRIKQKKSQSVDEMLVNLHYLALDPFYLVGKRLNTVEQNLLKFRSLSFQNITDICLKKCLQPKGIEGQLSHPGSIESELSMKVDRKQSCGESFGPSVSYLAVGVTNRTNSEIPGLKESFNEHQLCSISETRIKQKKAQLVDEMLVNLHCLALDPFYLVGLNTVEQNLLRFRSLSFQNITDICLKKCSQPIEGQLSHPGSIESELSMKVDRKQSCGESFGPSVSYTDNPVNCLGLKRKLDHQPYVSCSSFKLHKTIPTTAYLQINKTGCKENSSDSYISGPALSDLSHHGHIVEIAKLQEPEERVDMLNDARACISCVTRQETGRSVSIWEDDEGVEVDCNLNLHRPLATQSAFNHIIGTHANVIEVDSRLAAKICLSQSDPTVDKIKMLPSDGVGTTSVRSNKEPSISVTSRDSYKENKELYQPVTSDSSFELRRGQQLEALAACTTLHMKFPRDLKLPSKQELVKELSPFSTVDSLKTKISSYTGAAQVVLLHPTDALAAYQFAKENRVLFGGANIRFWLDPLEHKRRGTQSLVPSPSLTGKAVDPKSCQPVSSDTSFKSQRGKQLEALANIAASTSLHMKFPKDFELPSKEELIKKFSPFGTVDSSRTKISSCTGAAKVVFVHPTGAMAACQYAKKEKLLFGEANIRFWLDPLEHMRRGTKFSVPSTSLTGKPVSPKSCPPVCSNSSFKSQRVEKLKALATIAASSSLCIKFPKDFKLPSKQELVKRFRPFGTVDPKRTKAFSHKDAVRVVFLRPLDAFAAYIYAKKKKVLFGGANIRFWLEQLEHRRRGTKSSVESVPSPVLTGEPVNLKSCLKKSHPIESKDKQKPYKIPLSSEYEQLRNYPSSPRRIIVMNKMDLANRSQMKEWIRYFEQQNCISYGVNSHNKENIKQFLNFLQAQVRELKKTDHSSYTTTIMLVGIPNVGKSALVNSLHQIGRISAAEKGKLKHAIVSPHPGETKDISSLKDQLEIA
ncbi:uncharacterized protein LOC132174933 isoform X2 [Corylus avellana]|uniref:uncharacterized protein LOC132174933 isoform X2 n=1 Tax=Corylus avellana TaxID=13451 RepID=UPI00286C0B0E|nr:uncharacterized protein LOC132174933 isoform X2 [Corylus avellana]